MSREIQVVIRSDEATSEELDKIRVSLESQEGWQITGDENDDFYFTVSVLFN